MGPIPTTEANARILADQSELYFACKREGGGGGGTEGDLRAGVRELSASLLDNRMVVVASAGIPKAFFQAPSDARYRRGG